MAATTCTSWLHVMAATTLCLGLVDFANALIAREARLPTATPPPLFDLSSFNHSVDMSAEIASFMGSDAAKTTKMETVCDPETSSLPQRDAVIVVLVPPTPMTWRGGSTLKTLDSMKNIQDGNRAEVRLFHDERDNLSKEDMEKMFELVRPRKVCAVKIKFAQFPPGFKLQEKHPEGLPDKWFAEDVWHEEKAHIWSWNYLHMIRFNFVDLIDPNIGMLAGFKFWMRMDSDTRWADKIPDEFGNFDRDDQLGYLNNVEFADGGSVVAGLNQFTRDFAQSHGMDLAKMPALNDFNFKVRESGSGVGGYYNNLELGRIEMFQTPLALEFTRDIIQSRGIYLHRWGDAILRRLVVELTGMKKHRIQDDTLRKFRHGDWAPLKL